MINEQTGGTSAQSARIALSGEYDIGRQPELEAELARAGAGSTVELDMRDVTYIDSTALTCFIRLRKRLGTDAVIRLFGLRPNIRRVFTLTNLESIFEMIDEPDETAAGPA
ncbi:MAG TPA: STAS domain-containing protein [Candidatus Baltobacteraceae bacterium]|jgi:anti-anti-sigma factor|nr:STAS domain-containing protein [Candidatus Baltobacteraceae bacterium]